MAKKEVKTDLWVARQLDDSKSKYDPQRRYLVVKTKYRQFFLSHSCTAATLCQ